jgi:hypothetical protein
MTTTSVDEVIEFLSIAGEKGFLNTNTVFARKTACNKLFSILEPDQKTVEYAHDNLAVIKSRFLNLNKGVSGNTIEIYARRVKLVLDDFNDWKNDRASWERKVSARQGTRPTGDAEKKMQASTSNTEKVRPQPKGNERSSDDNTKPDTRVVTFPIRKDFDLSITLPRAGITVLELKKLAYFLLPYATDWAPTDAKRGVFPMLESDEAA